ncbi:MAG: PLP-dependent aminotransferase family protein [Propionicimonas sp.]|nr:PLP-dependent aminotransferase family protein [Propionicimonas sp.]
MPQPALEPFPQLLPLPADQPAYLALAKAVRQFAMDGTLAVGSRLPAERTLAAALGVSRTTVTAAYARLVDAGWATARQGSGTVVRLPQRDRVLARPAGPREVIDLRPAAGVAVPAVSSLVEQALEWLPKVLASPGYENAGALHLRERIAGWFEARGVPTVPGQIVVTPGALAGLAVVLRTVAGTDAAVLVDDPTYPDALAAAEGAGVRVASVPLGDGGWDTAGWAIALRRERPAAAYLVPDFHNPTGQLMPDEARRELVALLRRSRCTAIVDETVAGLDRDGGDPVTPWAALDDTAITLGSLSKVLWGGIRIGWVRCPEALVEQVRGHQLQLNLGPSALDQLVATSYLDDPGPVRDQLLARMREAREAWLDDLDWNLPDWRVERPRGGLALWVQLPAPRSAELVATAERHGVLLSPGTTFSVSGGQADRLRLPLTVAPGSITEAVNRLADAWQDLDRP